MVPKGVEFEKSDVSEFLSIVWAAQKQTNRKAYKNDFWYVVKAHADPLTVY